MEQKEENSSIYSDRAVAASRRTRSRILQKLIVPLIVVSLTVPLWAGSAEGAQVPAGFLNPVKIPKWVNQIDGPPPVWEATPYYDPETGELLYDYEIKMVDDIYQQILPAPLPMTHVWGYAGIAKDALTGASLGNVASSPGASFEAAQGEQISVKWVNEIDDTHMFAVDPTLHWANPNDMMMLEPPFEPYPPGYEDAQSPVPLVTHLHGAEVQSTSDGGPEAWFTYNGLHGSAYSSKVEVPGSNWAIYTYPNEQNATTLWYHDHALGITRINVMSGLAGFYLLRNSSDPIAQLLPSGKYEVPLVIQDRTFLVDGSMWFDTVGIDPNVHPYWMPEFFGNTIMVNGKVWPNMNVDNGQYRFKLLDGSNARFYTLSFVNMKNERPIPFTIIGSDGGYLKSPATVTEFTIAPGERYDVLVDFSKLKAGTKVLMKNTAKTPFPNGASAQGATTGQIMQFTVTGNPGFEPKILPQILNEDLSVFPSLPQQSVDKTRLLVLTEVMGSLGPTEVLLNGLKWHFETTENSEVGATEDWVIMNPTADTHPIHLHLTQFQLISRQRFDSVAYYNDWLALQPMQDGMMAMPPFHNEPVPLDPAMYLKGPVSPVNPWEQGWKDTVQMNPGEVTIIRVRIASITTPVGGEIDENGNFPFDPTVGPGYVWHCHILDHEDNEMMRPYAIVRTD